MTLHMLKTWPGFFDAVADGSKTFEVRWNDRNFKVGDCLKLHSYDPAIGYLGGEITRWVNYVLSADATLPGVRPGFVVLGLSSSDRPQITLSRFLVERLLWIVPNATGHRDRWLWERLHAALYPSSAPDLDNEPVDNPQDGLTESAGSSPVGESS